MSILSLRDPRLLRQQLFIDAPWHDADNGATIPVHNPANGEALVTVANAPEAETQRAIEAAARAFDGWRARPADERAQVLSRRFAP